MRDQSGMALIVVMGLLVVVSLIGVGLISQTIENSKFFEALGTSYIGLQSAQKDLTTQDATNSLARGIGRRPSDAALTTVLYARRGQVWKPDLSTTFSDISTGFNGIPSWTVNQVNRTISSSFSPTGKKEDVMDESSFLFKDDANVLPCWTSYDLHVEFIADISPGFGIYYNASVTGKGITGYLFEISPINTLVGKDSQYNSTFSIREVHSGNPNPGASEQLQKFDGSLASWTNASSNGTGDPFDSWHTVDISVRGESGPGQSEKLSSVRHIIRVDGTQAFDYLDTSGSIFEPGLIGLGNWSGNGWGSQATPSSVSFRNISVTAVHDGP